MISDVDGIFRHDKCLKLKRYLSPYILAIGKQYLLQYWQGNSYINHWRVQTTVNTIFFFSTKELMLFVEALQCTGTGGSISPDDGVSSGF